MEAGKDVFVEKPLSYNVGEGRMMVGASLKYKRVTQMGNHIHNDYPNYRRVVEMVQSEKIGTLPACTCGRRVAARVVAAEAPAPVRRDR